MDLLRRIGDGSVTDGTSDIGRRISAAALRRRGLIRTSGRGSSWSASLTAPGRQYLDEVDTGEGVLPRQGNASVTEQLVQDLVAAGGTLRRKQNRWCVAGEVDYERRARLAEIYGKVPDGRRLVVTRVSPEEIELRLCDAPGYLGGRATLDPINVPQRVGRYHSLARQFRERRDVHEVSRAHVSRATRIVHSLATEADRRGWRTDSPPATTTADRNRRSGWTGPKSGHLALAVADERFWIRLVEEGVNARGAWEREVSYYRNVSSEWWSSRRPLPRGRYDEKATGKLRLELYASRYWLFRGRQSRWADGHSGSVEARISEVFREVTERVAEAARFDEERRLAAQVAAERDRRAAQQRLVEWHLVVEEARQSLVEANRAASLSQQAEAWQTADLLNRYLDALEATQGDDPRTAEWVRWGRDFARDRDPLAAPVTFPPPPEATTESLQPFMPPGWSAAGP